MSYTQNNPFSRKSSPLNKDDQWIQKATADIKKRGTEGVCTGDKFGSESCPPGSKRYNLAKTFKKMAKNRKDGPSRESSSPLNQDERSGEEWVEKGTGTGDRYPDPRKKKDWKKGKKGDKGDVYGGNKGDESKSKRDYEGVSRQPYGGNKGDEKKSVRDYEGPSRKSSSPLNQNHDERSGRLRPDYSDYEEQQKRHGITTSTEPYVPPADDINERSGNRFPGVRDGQRDATTFITSHPNYISREDWDNATDEQKGISRKSSPLNNTGITGLNYSKELQYMPIEDDMHRGMSRQSSSPLNDNGYNQPNPNWNQKKHDRQVKRVTRKLKKGKGVKLEKFGPEVIMESMRNTEKKGN